MSINEQLAEKIYEMFYSIEAIQRYIAHSSYEAFYADQEKQDAVDMRFIHIGECATDIKQIDNEFIKRNSHIPWKEMSGMRNIIAHDYLNVNPKVTWETAVTSIHC